MSHKDRYVIRPIAYVRSDYNEKFGIPRQAGLVDDLEQAIVIEPEFRNIDAIRGLEEFSRIWLIWGFSENTVDMEADTVRWSPTVRPPRLGGKIRKGVWASRSPYRPNSLGMSNVRLVRIMLGDRVLYDADIAKSNAAESSGVDAGEILSGETSQELAIIVAGADMMNGTPVFDIKPYIPYSDSHPEASRGYTSISDTYLEVIFPDELLGQIDESKRAGLKRVLELDPRGAYEKKDGHTYGLSFADYDIKFIVNKGVLTVTGVEPAL